MFTQRLFKRRSKKTSKLRVTGLCEGNSPGTGEFPTQIASYAENFSIWWRHHEINLHVYPLVQWWLAPFIYALTPVSPIYASHRVKLGMLAPVGGCRHLILLDVSNCACLQRIVLFAGRGSSSAHPKSTDIKANEIYRQVSNIKSPKSQLLTHWGRDKMAAIFQTTFSHAFSWMKMNDIRLKFHWNLFLMFQLTIFQHWFR